MDHDVYSCITIVLKKYLLVTFFSVPNQPIVEAFSSRTWSILIHRTIGTNHPQRPKSVPELACWPASYLKRPPSAEIQAKDDIVYFWPV